MDLPEQLKQAGAQVGRAVEERDALILKAAAEGMTRRQIAEHVGLSFQRVQQIIKPRHRRAHR